MKVLHAALSATLVVGCSAPVEGPDPGEMADPAVTGELKLEREAIDRAGIQLGQVQVIRAPNVLRLPGQVTLNEDRTAVAGSFIEGIVTECCKSVGSSVAAGDVLAELHSHLTHELLGEYRQAQAALDARRSERTYAAQALDRARRLLELRAGTQRAVQEAETDLAVSETAVRSAEAALESTLAHFEYLGIGAGDLPTGETSEDLRVHVRSPISGVIVARDVARGDVVSPSTPLYRISDLSRVWVVARAAEQQLVSVTPGMTAHLRVRAFPGRAFAGSVLRISDELDEETKTVQVIVAMPNPRRALKSGMYGDIELRSTATEEILAAPEAAVQLVDSQTTVFVPDAGGVFSPTPVTVGRTIGGMVEIVSGLEPEETIVVDGAFALKSELLKARFAEE